MLQERCLRAEASQSHNYDLSITPSPQQGVCYIDGFQKNSGQQSRSRRLRVQARSRVGDVHSLFMRNF